jgi:hypothetical protein
VGAVAEEILPAVAPPPPRALNVLRDVRWRYSYFIHQVEAGNVEKVIFEADGLKMLAIDTDGGRHIFDSIPEDTELLSTLQAHQV